MASTHLGRAVWMRLASTMLLITVCMPTIVAQTNWNGVLDARVGSVLIPHDPAFNLAPKMTIEAWLKPEHAKYAYGVVFDKGEFTNGFSLGVSSFGSAADSIRTVVYIAGKATAGPIIRSDSLTWTHVAVTIDSTVHKIGFFINGISVQTSTMPVGFSNNAEAVRIGTSAYGDQFWGMIDEVRVWNVIRTPDEIAALWRHEAKGIEPDLVAVYHFEDERDSVAWNRSALGGLHGTLGLGIIVKQSRPSAYVDENEFNGNRLYATPLGYGSTVLTAAVAPGDTDYYKIYCRASDILRVQTSAKNPGDVNNLLVSVYSVDSALHVTSYVGNFPSFVTGVSVTGYRYIRVHVNSGAGGSYVLTTSLYGYLGADAHEPNNTKAQATPLQWGSLTFGAMMPGADAPIAARDTDYYSVAGVANEIGLFPWAIEGASTGSPYVYVLGPSGLLNKSYRNSRPNVRFPSTDTYHVRITPNEATCQYVLGIFKGLADIHEMLYDPMTFGSGVYLLDGVDDAYDGAYVLNINGVAYQSLPDYTLSECGGRQFCFAPVTMSGLTVRRKFFVPTAAQGDTLGFLRIQEILSNPTGAPITVNVGVSSNLGAGAGCKVIGSSSGDSIWTAADNWAVTDDGVTPGLDPTLTHIIDGPDGADRVDTVAIATDQPSWVWRNVTVQPGETKIYMYFVAQDSIPENALKKGPAFSRPSLPATAKLGLDADAVHIRNWNTSALVSVDPQTPRPIVFALDQNYPNPFNPQTLIRAQWPSLSDVTLEVFDILGRRVAILANGRYPAGRYEFTFDASRCGSGVYFYRIEAKGEASMWADVKKMVVVR